LEKKTYILQGFGNVGSWTAHYLHGAGAICQAIGDYTGYYLLTQRFYDLHKFDDILKHKELKDILALYEGIEKIDIADFWKIKTDIVIPAAMELQITEEIAKKMDCRLIVEGANGPIDTEADQILNERNITVIPDVLANGGGVVVSFYEWKQNCDNEHWTREDVKDRLTSHLRHLFEKFVVNATTSIRQSVYIDAINRLIMHK
jgi:glutamate dehydrogenase/leucine dehydrogenase